MASWQAEAGPQSSWQHFLKVFLAIIHISSLEVDSDVEVFEMKHEIVSLQTKIEDGMCILTPLFYAEAFSF